MAALRAPGRHVRDQPVGNLGDAAGRAVRAEELAGGKGALHQQQQAVAEHVLFGRAHRGCHFREAAAQLALVGLGDQPRGMAALLAVMGIFDLVGTTGSGWLTDRYDPRKLLFMYYGLRGLSVFAVFFGLDWISTVPPTLRLATEAFGERDAPVIFGWIAAGHQIGAASAAFFAGYMRALQGDYLQAFVIAGTTGVVAAVLALALRGAKPAPAPA